MSASALGGASEIEPDQCRSAEQYVLEALEASAAARSPKELAMGYGCTSDHTRNVMSDLAKEGRIKRVEEGLYTSVDGDGAEPDADSILSDAPEGVATDVEVTDDASGSDTDDGPTDAEEAAETETPPPIADDERADVVDVEATESGGEIGAGTALVAATGALALIVLATGRSGSSSESTEEVEEEADDGGDEADLTEPEVWS